MPAVRAISRIHLRPALVPADATNYNTPESFRPVTEHLRGTHQHLQGRDATQFAADGEFPVKRWAKAH
jgi:hypothetical protein